MRAKVKYWLAPGLRAVELIAADYIAQRFSPHWHTGFAVGVVTRNTQQFSCGGHNWMVGPGDVIALNPGQLHDGSSLHPEGWSSRMAYVPEATLARFVHHGTVDEDHPALRFAAPVVHAPALAHKVLQWHLAAEAGPQGDCVDRAAELFGDLLRWMRRAAAGDPMATSLAFSERLRHLADDAPDAVAQRFTHLHVSRTTSWRQMRAQLGIGPQPLATQLRLMSAKRQLAFGRPILDTALDAGYHDQSHFTRHFVAAYGMTPAQFRREQQRE